MGITGTYRDDVRCEFAGPQFRLDGSPVLITSSRRAREDIFSCGRLNISDFRELSFLPIPVPLRRPGECLSTSNNWPDLTNDRRAFVRRRGREGTRPPAVAAPSRLAPSRQGSIRPTAEALEAA